MTSMSNKPSGPTARAACRALCVPLFLLAGDLALAAQQADPALPAAPGAVAPAAGAGGAALPPPSLASSALAGASNLSFSWSGYFEALAILCFALALLWAVLWLVKRHGRGGFLGNTAGMRVENRLALGPKKWIIVVRYLDRRLVLGLTDQKISLLTEIPLESGPAEKTAGDTDAGKAVAARAATDAGFAGKNEKDGADQLFASLLRAGKENEHPAG